MIRLAAWTVGAAALIGSTLIAIPADADPGPTPTCASLATVGNPPSPVVYAQVGDTQTNLMKNLGRALRDNTPNPATLVYFTSGSCSNITALYTGVKQKMNMVYIPSVEEDAGWTEAEADHICTVPVDGVALDIGNSAVFTAACTEDMPPATVKLTSGPIQAYVLAVPKASSQTAITYEEAYFVFGFGAAGMITPWIDVSNLFIRTVTKSTLLTWAANINVPAPQWQGGCGSGGGPSKGCGSSDTVVSLLENAADPESALGILGDEVYDALRDKLTVLAFRANHQYAAYYPDKTSTTREKINIRDGHYTVWSPTVWIDNVNPAVLGPDGQPTPLNPLARYIINMIAGIPVTPVANFAPDKVVAGVGLVPDCAMQVSRTVDGGPLSLYSPTTSCTCEYEATVDTTSCAACDVNTPCATGVCRNNLCEAK